jgi:hypothetical protein
MLTELGERLALIIDARTDGAVSNIQRLSAEEKAAADRAEVLKAKLADLEARAARSPGSKSTAVQLSRTRSELAGLESTLATVPSGASAAEKGLAKLGLQGTITGSALVKGFGAAATAGLAFGGFEFLKHGVDEFEALAGQIRAVQQASGGTAEDASRLVAVTNALGVDAQTAALGVFRLGKNIAETPQNLAKYNIAIAHTKDGNVDLIATLGNVADAYQKTEDPTRRAALVAAAFGRAGTTMLPILNANRQQLEEIAKTAQKQGLIFSADDLQRARDLQIATREMKDSFEGMAVSASKTLVPALTDAANKVRELLDSPVGKAANALFQGLVGIATGPLEVYDAVTGSGGSKKKLSAAQELAQEQANQQALAAQQALSQAAASTLGDTSSLLATPGQGLADAKQGLKDARQTLADAISTRNKAAKELAAARVGAPGADASALAAAVARVEAAKAKLRAAEYVGGDARVAGAQATLATAQKDLNKLRSEGGTATNKLAAATERLHKANEAVTAAQQKEKAAQRAKNQASGFSATDIKSQIDAQLKDKTLLAGAQTKLAGLGASADLIAFLDQANQRQAGTLVKAVAGLTPALVASLNDELAQKGTQVDLYTAIAGNPDAWRDAGADRAKSFATGWDSVLADRPAGGPYGPHGSLPSAAPSPGYRRGRAQAYGGDRPTTQNNFTGPITVQAQDPDQLARKLAAKRRLAALGGHARLD